MQRSYTSIHNWHDEKKICLTGNITIFHVDFPKLGESWPEYLLFVNEIGEFEPGVDNISLQKYK